MNERGNANIILIGVACVVLVLGAMWGIPIYSVWQQGLSGEADLKKAQQTRLILVEQAKAEKESAGYRAEAIEIVGQAAKDFPEYRIQEFLGSLGEAFREGNLSQVIYIPTDGVLPITEAYRLHDRRANQ